MRTARNGWIPRCTAFHSKWYLASHQVGDQSVANVVQAYRKGFESRDHAARSLGWVLLSVGVLALPTSMANTNLTVQLA